MQIFQIRAARAILDWSAADLARRAGIAATTMRRLESAPGPMLGGEENTRARILAALSGAGIEFIPGGVVLRKDDKE